MLNTFGTLFHFNQFHLICTIPLSNLKVKWNVVCWPYYQKYDWSFLMNLLISFYCIRSCALNNSIITYLSKFALSNWRPGVVNFIYLFCFQGMCLKTRMDIMLSSVTKPSTSPVLHTKIQKVIQIRHKIYRLNKN